MQALEEQVGKHPGALGQQGWALPGGRCVPATDSMGETLALVEVEVTMVGVVRGEKHLEATKGSC